MSHIAKFKIQSLYGLPAAQAPVTSEVLESVAAYFRRHKGRVLALTGAGVSVPSGIPDYRGSSGTYRVHGHYRPILYHELVSQHASRQRYWARSFFGIRPAFRAEPNMIHNAFASLEQAKYLAGLITQNVDGLHLAAGSNNVLELHGTLKNVQCLSCKQIESRDQFQNTLETLNPDWTEFNRSMARSGVEPARRPDGDVDLPPELRYEDFEYPKCRQCHTGDYMPTVVFFGGNVPDAVRSRSLPESLAGSGTEGEGSEPGIEVLEFPASVSTGQTANDADRRSSGLGIDSTRHPLAASVISRPATPIAIAMTTSAGMNPSNASSPDSVLTVTTIKRKGKRRVRVPTIE
ncbi:hypothetical protein GGI24_000791 [Coemansia furcata]|nr:hypothetical protein GGI24_000791 [Coemansia furcata]